MSAALRRAAFVVGVPRSGTTLFARLLDGHPQLFVLPFETHASQWAGRPDPVTPLLGRIVRERKYANQPTPEEQVERALRARLPGPASLEALLRAAVETVHELGDAPPRAEVWVEKTPRHLRIVPELMRIFGPETRVLALVRDPRAVMASRRTRFERIGAGNVRHFAQRWAYADALVRRCQARMRSRSSRSRRAMSSGTSSVRQRSTNSRLTPLCVPRPKLELPRHASPARVGARSTGSKSIERCCAVRRMTASASATRSS